MVDYTEIQSIFEDSTSDKEMQSSSGGHCFGLFYEMLINSLVFQMRRKVRVLEFGTSRFGAGSPKAFSEMECVELYIGIDNEEYDTPLPEHCKIYITDAYSTETLETIKSNYEYFDLIIDDCIHDNIHQTYIKDNYYEMLSPGGYLLTEDFYEASEPFREPSNSYLYTIIAAKTNNDAYFNLIRKPI